jgi:hypothetical protein
MTASATAGRSSGEIIEAIFSRVAINQHGEKEARPNIL